MTAAFDPSAYLAQLRERFVGKDPGRVPGKPRGKIIFCFREADGVHRATIDIGRSSVGVREGAYDDESEPCAFVLGSLADWLAFYEDGNKARMGAIDFYGDLWLLKALPELTHQQLSPLAARLSQTIPN